MPRPRKMNWRASPTVDEMLRRIADARLKQGALALQAGLGRQYVSYLRCGRRTNPGIQELEALADAAGIEIVVRSKEGKP